MRLRCIRYFAYATTTVARAELVFVALTDRYGRVRGERSAR
jgi:hypothetical protein